MQDQERSLEELHHYLNILIKTSQSEPCEAVNYWEITKHGQITDMKFRNTWVCEEDQHAKPCVYQVLQVQQPYTCKSPSNSIRCNCERICNCSRRPETILGVRKRPHFSRWSTSFSKTLLTTEKNANRVVVFYRRPPPSIQQSGKHNSFRHIELS